VGTTTKPNPYLDGWLNVVAHANLRFKEEQGSFSVHAAAYLREHFVTREEYDECYDAYSRLQIRGSSWVGNLESVTAERDRLRAAVLDLADNIDDWDGIAAETELAIESARQALAIRVAELESETRVEKKHIVI